MESALLAVLMLSSSSCGVRPAACLSVDGTEWNDAVVAREGTAATLVCIDESATGAVSVNWMARPLGTGRWGLVLAANERKEFSGGASKAYMQLMDHNFQNSGVFSLGLRPQMEDGGLYRCLVKRRQRVLKERLILLAVLQVTVVPSGPVPQHSTLRLIADVQPQIAVSKITWAAPGDISMTTEKMPKLGTVAKLPQVQNSDDGAYVCAVHLKGNRSDTSVAFTVDVTVDAERVASFTNIVHADAISTAALAHAVFPLNCPNPPGDYVVLYWRPPDVSRQSSVKLVHQYDRWRGTTLTSELSTRLRLAGPPHNARAGSFSFCLTPGLKDGGLYICEVFHNDNAFSQRTLLTVVKVKVKRSSRELELDCRYSELSQVQTAVWQHENESVRLRMDSGSLGSVTTSVPLPVRAETAGNYTCVLLLKNKQMVRAVYTVGLPPEHKVEVDVARPSSLPALSALLLAVPLVAGIVGAFLWRRRHISDRGVEQSLSVRSGEAENIYENPDAIRPAPPQGSVYMDLKPRGEDAVYKELERDEPCQS
ncbi:g6f-like [Eucyclogobius newberryi]|uniref:g6f-like n=1 Tax=Eucyclogobius newberryi TaxID=166745 RepID=UPI003B593583